MSLSSSTLYMPPHCCDPRLSPGTALGTETRVALGRCGHSSTNPFCDKSHFGAGFEAE